jgi:hypothetical protein
MMDLDAAVAALGQALPQIQHGTTANPNDKELQDAEKGVQQALWLLSDRKANAHRDAELAAFRAHQASAPLRNADLDHMLH